MPPPDAHENTVRDPAPYKERDAALNVAKTRQDRDRAAWRHDLARQLCGEPGRLAAMYEQQAKVAKR